MVGLGMLMLLLAFGGLWLRWRKQLYETKSVPALCLLMGPAGLIAILAGWFTTEIGRQPWIVYGVMRTKDAVSNHSVLTLSPRCRVRRVYFIVFGIGTSYMLKLVGKGPRPDEHDPGDGDQHGRPARPLSAAPDKIDFAPTHSDRRS
jgi:cytochrome d ubiquinol oxidase subunit I